MQNILPRPTSMAIHKAFVRPHLDYRDVIYDEDYKERFHQKLESIQYSACLALSGAIRGSSTEKLYQELGFGIHPTSTLVWETFLILQDF